MEDVINQIGLYKKEVLKSCKKIEVNNEVDEIFKRYFEKTMKSLVDLWLNELSDRIETKTNLYVDVKPFFEKSNLNENEFENMIKSNNSELIKIMKVKDILNNSNRVENT
ncbi:hypothetical protein [Clostridium saccharobutylicum]|uniref:Uncharacterized protein n=1 Tax=Clostridium saccharobutylicum TaxID=169679 RepID=A0A1S8MZ15_CLOSA|nr:hypothetical protein [Clostridium saccharobutylicum]OOM09420.1 hypothetical protein CLOSAC_37010 [Clostridium saccharobutylicum]